MSKQEKTGPYEVRKQNRGKDTDSQVAAGPDLKSAKDQAEKLAENELLWKDVKLSWKVINDGTKPGNVQVYHLVALEGAVWTGYSIHGPHVGS